MTRYLCLLLMFVAGQITTAEYQALHGDCHVNGPGVYSVGHVIHCGCARYSEPSPVELFWIMTLEKDKSIKKLASRGGVWHCVEIEPSSVTASAFVTGGEK